MTSERGQFIVVEGLEGAGKSSAMHAIKSILASNVKELITTHEPGGTAIGDVLRNIIKQPVAGELLDPRAELLLLYASRVQLVEQRIRPALSRGCWVLSDRFELSTIAYQGGGRKLSQDMISSLSQFCLEGLKPDLTIFLDIRPEEGLRRALERSKADRIEQESVAFFNDVYDSYHDQLKTLNSVVLIDASQSIQVVQQQVADTVLEFIKQRRAA